MDIGVQDCRNRILSNDYRDILVDIDIPLESLFEGRVENPDYCEQTLLENLRILHVAASQALPLDSTEYRYQYIPKCYGLLQDEDIPGEIAQLQADPGAVPDLTALSEAGILSVSGPPLELTGRNVIIGIIDTGERVIIMSS